eukprot:3502030-Amphidinium_carterae.1
MGHAFKTAMSQQVQCAECAINFWNASYTKPLLHVDIGLAQNLLRKLTVGAHIPPSKTHCCCCCCCRCGGRCAGSHRRC